MDEVLSDCCCLVAQFCDPMDCIVAHLCPWDHPVKSTGMGHYFLLQGVFPTQGSNPCLRISCPALRFSTTEPLGKPLLGDTWS